MADLPRAPRCAWWFADRETPGGPAANALEWERTSRGHAGMRVLVIGGTRFIGRQITEALLARGDRVLVVHRGQHEPPDLPSCRHLHTDRAEFAGVADVLPEDMALTGGFAQHMLAVSDKANRLLGWSSRPTPDSVARSVGWHLAHPPESASDDFTADDRALATERACRRVHECKGTANSAEPPITVASCANAKTAACRGLQHRDRPGTADRRAAGGRTAVTGRTAC